MDWKKILLNFEEVIGAFALGFMTILAFANVIARYCFSASLSFTDEITTMLFVLISLLGSGIAAKRHAHTGLNVFTDFIPQKYQKYVTAFGAFWGIVFNIILLYYGILMVEHEYTTKALTSGMQWPEWIWGSFVPIGSAVMLIRFVQVFINALRSKEVE
jgi:C4-dicarboxylate transporter DctQ subunit